MPMAAGQQGGSLRREFSVSPGPRRLGTGSLSQPGCASPGFCPITARGQCGASCKRARGVNQTAGVTFGLGQSDSAGPLQARCYQGPCHSARS